MLIAVGIPAVVAEYTPTANLIPAVAAEADPKNPDMVEAICEFARFPNVMFAPPVVVLLTIPSQ
jgi:hypothetical protein